MPSQIIPFLGAISGPSHYPAHFHQVSIDGEFGDELLVGVGVGAAQLVVEVGDGNHDAEVLAQFKQHAQQRNRVCTTRDGDSYTVSGAWQVAFADVVKHLVAHGMMV